MHELIEKMHAAFESATATLHAQVSAHTDASKKKAAELNSQRLLHVDPMNAMAAELARIQQLLAHQVVRPDIVGWTPGAASATPFRLGATSLLGSTSLPGSTSWSSPTR